LNFLFLSELLYPHGGGAEFATYLYAKLLGKAGHSVTVVTNKFPDEPDSSKFETFTVIRLPLFSRRASGKFSMLARLDVVLSSSMRRLINWSDLVYVPRYWFSAIPVAQAFGKPVITHLHDYIPICPLATLYDHSRKSICRRSKYCSSKCIFKIERSRFSLPKSVESTTLNFLFRPVLKRLIEKSNAIVCVSEAQKEAITACLPSIKEKAFVVPNPLPELSIVPIERNEFGYFGGSNPLKGFHVLTGALKYLGNPTITVHAADFREPERYNALRRYGLIPYQRIEKQNMDTFFRKIGTVVFPSVCPEPSPYVISEAMMRERMVIASNIGGIPEQTKGCKGVFLSSPGDPIDLATKLTATNSLSKEEVADFGAGNREVFTRSFNNDISIRKFLKLSEDIA
jgi:glycosyltransferase involved in cell wall biosynthesis